jgi:hypothetical protein
MDSRRTPTLRRRRPRGYEVETECSPATPAALGADRFCLRAGVRGGLLIEMIDYRPGSIFDGGGPERVMGGGWIVESSLTTAGAEGGKLEAAVAARGGAPGRYKNVF